MEQDFNILLELKEICPAVAEIRNTNVYSVPYSYFESLPGQIFQKIEKEESRSRLSFEKTEVPEGYFDSLAGQILNKIKALKPEENEVRKELDLVAPILNSIGRLNVYNVPAGYFEAFPALVNANNILVSDITNELNDVAPFLYTISKENLYNVPANYFEAFPALVNVNNILVSDITNELNDVAPFLNTIGKENLYKVPAGYFEELSSSILKANKPAAKVVAFSSKKVLKYAVAAIITGVMAISSFLLLNKETSIAANPQFAYSETAIQHLSDDEIFEYLNSRTTALDVSPSAFTISAETNENDDLLEEVSETEMNKYLRENAEPGEEALNGI